MCADTDWVKKAYWFRRQFEDLLRDTVEISNGRVRRKILDSGELNKRAIRLLDDFISFKENCSRLITRY